MNILKTLSIILFLSSCAESHSAHPIPGANASNTSNASNTATDSQYHDLIVKLQAENKALKDQLAGQKDALDYFEKRIQDVFKDSQSFSNDNLRDWAETILSKDPRFNDKDKNACDFDAPHPSEIDLANAYAIVCNGAEW